MPNIHVRYVNLSYLLYLKKVYVLFGLEVYSFSQSVRPFAQNRVPGYAGR